LLLAGIAYGGVQNLTLAQAFTVAGEPARATVSIVWNLSFDAGTGIGAFGTGLGAVQAGRAPRLRRGRPEAYEPALTSSRGFVTSCS
jgi:hypothetical protein